AYVVSHDGEFREALTLTDRSDALYTGLDRPWDQTANWLFAARAAISAGDEERAVDALAHVRQWLQAVDDPVEHIGRAAATSRRLGFQQTEAYQLSSLGRAQCQSGDYHAGSATLNW